MWAESTRTGSPRIPARRLLTKKLIGRFPGTTVHGHNEFAAKACPSFDAKKDWAKHLETASLPEEIEAEPVELPRPILRRGDSGVSVRTLQRLLAIKIDGRFGPATEEAVKSFQTTVGLVADGVVGPQTWGRLV
jgi:peptidoglycan hydrolase-like protein with peptidoglycan-binding domain